jgi:hypothetical protein
MQPYKKHRHQEVTSGTKASDSSSEDDHSITDATLSQMPKPRGLIDALSSFFTPTDKRKSRVSLSSRTVIPALAQPPGKKRGRPNGSCKQNTRGIVRKNAGKTQQAASKLIKKSCQLQVNKQHNKQPKKKHKKVEHRLGRPKGSDQVKSLYDGLSHLFCARGDRRPIPASLLHIPSSPPSSSQPSACSPPPPPPSEPKRRGRKPAAGVKVEQGEQQQQAVVAVARPPCSISSVCHHDERLRGRQLRGQPPDMRGLRSDVSLRGLKYPLPPLSKLTSSSSSGKQQCDHGSSCF